MLSFSIRRLIEIGLFFSSLWFCRRGNAIRRSFICGCLEVVFGRWRKFNHGVLGRLINSVKAVFVGKIVVARWAGVIM